VALFADPTDATRAAPLVAEMEEAMSDLVERLRTAVTYGYMPHRMREVAEQAAAALESQAARIAALEGEMKAAREAALEEAAKVADRHREKWRSAGGFEGFATGAKLIAAAIRALSGERP
jgi:hypothetical protein